MEPQPCEKCGNAVSVSSYGSFTDGVYCLVQHNTRGQIKRYDNYYGKDEAVRAVFDSKLCSGSGAVVGTWKKANTGLDKNFQGD